MLRLVLTVVAVTASSTVARAEPRAPKKPRWQSAQPAYGPGNFALTAAFGGAGLFGALRPTMPSARRSGPFGFDEPVRDGLRLDTDGARRDARLVSDVLVGVLLLYPFVVDAALTTALWHKRRELSWKMALINAEAMALTVGVHGLVSLAVARERPYGLQCGAATEGECAPSGARYRSFYSAHTANAFNAAGLICSHHLALDLHGRAADLATCAAALAAATAVGTLRVAGDMHWASDVVVGAGMGALTGFGVPLLHYAGGVPTFELGAREHGVRASVVPHGLGVGLAGAF